MYVQKVCKSTTSTSDDKCRNTNEIESLPWNYNKVHGYMVIKVKGIFERTRNNENKIISEKMFCKEKKLQELKIGFYPNKKQNNKFFFDFYYVFEFLLVVVSVNVSEYITVELHLSRPFYWSIVLHESF